MMTKQRGEPATPRAARAAARDRAARGGLAAAARGIARKTAAAAGVALRAVRRGLGRGARCVAPPPRAHAPEEEAAAELQPAEEEPAEQSSVLLRLMPPPALVSVAAEPFKFRGADCQTSSQESGLFAKPTADTTAASLLELCATWLRVPAEVITIRGARRTLSSAAPQRTIAEAGLFFLRKTAASGAVTLQVTVVPWCCVCLSPARRGRVWTCDGAWAGARHSCCHRCARRYAESAAVLRPSLALSWLRCPGAGCGAVMAQGAAMQRLLSFKAIDTLRAQRAADQAKRLSRVRAGREDAGLAQMLRRGDVKPCPACAALIEKDGGCNHVSCAACGAFFDWSCM